MKPSLLVYASVSTGVIFLVDLFTPIAVTVGILYVVPVYLAGMTSQRRALLAIAASCTLLNFVVFMIAPRGGSSYAAVLNHLLAAAGIWATAALSIYQHHLHAVIQTVLPLCVTCKKIRDEEGKWQSIRRYVRQHTTALVKYSVCPTCFKDSPSDHIHENDE